MCEERFNWAKVRTKRAKCEVRGGVANMGFDTAPGLQENTEHVLSYAGFGTGASSYACTPDNLIRGARKRLLGVRQNNVEEHLQLVKNQLLCTETAGCRAFKRHFAREIKPLRDALARQQEWVEAPHPKRGLRRRVAAKNHARGKFVKDYRAYTDYKSKPGELLAAGKQLRAIGEISDESAFELGPSASLHKDVYAVPFYFGCGVSTFIKGPTDTELSRAFELLINGPTVVRHIYFSDDSCLAVSCLDGLFLCNIDFSWSDGSMFWPAFEYAKSVWSQDVLAREEIANSFLQCQKPIRLINRVAGFKPGTTTPYEYIEIPLAEGHYALASGYGGTTNMNNNSQGLFFSAMMSLNFEGRSKKEIPDLVHAAARMAGLQVKVDVCEVVEDIQFLKHSWVRSDGEYKPMVNLACWLRGLGMVQGHAYGDGVMQLRERLARFTGDVVESRANWGSTSLSDAFRLAFPTTTSGKNEHLLRDERARTGILGARFTDDEVCRRYRLDVAQFQHFCELVKTLDVGVYINHPVVGRIMEKDYGYSSKHRLPKADSTVAFAFHGGRNWQVVDSGRAAFPHGEPPSFRR